MRTCNTKNRFCRKGLTLVELVISMALVLIVFSAIMPQFGVMFRSLNLRQASAETLQNSRVFLDHVERSLAQAVAITAVSLSTDDNGYIEFTGTDGNAYRYDCSDYYIRFGLTGQQQIMAGPVSGLRFSCYALTDLDTPITTLASISYIQVDTVFTDPTGYNQEETVTASVLRAASVVVEPSLALINYSFEEPGTGKINGWDNAGNDIPGWSSSSFAGSSGVESDARFPATHGNWTGFLKDTDPSVYNLTDYVIENGDEFTVQVDLRDNSTSGITLRIFWIRLYYGDTLSGSRTTLDSMLVFDLPDGVDGSSNSWRTYTVEVAANSVPASIGKKIGVELDNVSISIFGDSWIGVDNVRLSVSNE